MQRTLPRLSTIALGLTLAWPASGQEAAPQADAAPADAGTPAEGKAAPQAAPTASGEDAPQAPAEGAPAEGAPAPGTPEAGPAQPGAPVAEQGAAPLAPGAPAVPAPMAGQQEEQQVVVRETFGDWDVRCAENTDECALHQFGLDEDDNPVVEFSLFRVPEGDEAAALVNLLSPLGTFLPSGITIQVDEGQARQYGFTFCTMIGCVAQIALTEDTIAAMRRGRVAALSLASIASPEEPVEIELSLMGFTDAFNSVAPTPVE